MNKLKISRDSVPADLVAGLTTAIVNIPQGMAYALIAAVNPIYGLYTGVVAPIVGALTTNSNFMIITVTGEVALVTGAVLADLGSDASIEALFTLTLLVGVIVVLFGLLKLESILRFVSNAVMMGFLAGTAVLIALGQLDDMLGYSLQVDGNAVAETWDVITNLNQADPASTVIGLLTIAVIVLLQRTRLKNVAMILALIVTSALVGLLGWSSVELVRDISEIPRGLPTFTLPDLSVILALLPGALAISILGLTDSAATSLTLAEQQDEEIDISRDFVGIGFANLVGSFFQNMPAAGSLSRSNVGIAAGARTRWTNVFAGLILALLLVAIAGLAEWIPMPALAGLLIYIGVDIVIGIWDEIVFVFKTSRVATLAMVFTFIAISLLPLVPAIFLGVLLSLTTYVITSSTNIRVVELVPVGDDDFEEHPGPSALTSGQATVLRVYGSTYFAAVPSIKDHLPSTENTRNAVVILTLRGISKLGSTYLGFLADYSEHLRESGNRLMLAGVQEEMVEQLRETAVHDFIGEDNVFPARPIVGEATYQALTSAKAWIDRQTILLNSAPNGDIGDV